MAETPSAKHPGGSNAPKPRSAGQLCLQPASNERIPKAGRLSFHTAVWKQVTCNQFILNVVQYGYKIQFHTLPPFIHIKSSPFSPSRTYSITQEISSLLAKSAIKPIAPSDDQFVSPIFDVPKKDTDNRRVILNLKYLNNFIRKTKFRLEGYDVIFSMIRVNDFLVSIDLHDAFLTLSMHPLCFKYLCFEWLNVRYCYTCMPFGMTSSPRIFTKVLKPVLVFLRSRGLRVTAWFDDIILMANSINLLLEHLYFARIILRSLGFLINDSKSSLIPSKTMLHLGYLWDTETYTLSVPQDKVCGLKALCSSALDGPVSLRNLQRILGTIESFKIAFPYAALRYRSLQRDVATHVSAGYEWDTKITPSPLSRRDLEWWQSYPTQLPPRSLAPFEPQYTVTSDSSSTGWGAFSSTGQEAFGFWSEDESRLHINILECKAVLFSFLSFFRDFSDTSILIKSDNSTTVAYINHQGGVKCPVISDLVFELFEFCLARNILIKASFLRGRYNSRADALSRRAKIHSYSLPSSLFLSFCNTFSLSPTIDLFASRLNNKLPMYFSEGPDPHCCGFDAFLLDWPSSVYAFPPISLVGKFLNKFLQYKNSEALLITPFWPSQPYFPTLLELLADKPILFPVSLLKDADHLPRHLYNLLAWPITSSPDRTLDYQMSLSPACSEASRRLLWNSTILHGQDLAIGVIQNKLVTATCL